MISVICSTYNSAKTLRRAIKSVLLQTYKNFEFILINDASTDNTKSILKEYSAKDSRIITITNAKNIGLTKSLNIGLRRSVGYLIARIDADDIWHKDKLRQQINFLKRFPEYGIVGTNVFRLNSATKKIYKHFMPESDEKIRQSILRTTPFVHSAILFKKNLFGKYDEKYVTSQDYYLYYTILMKTKGYNIQNFLTYKSTGSLNAISCKKWKTQRKNRILLRYQVFKHYNHNIFDYRYFITDMISLLFPKKIKELKLRLKTFNKIRN